MTLRENILEKVKMSQKQRDVAIIVAVLGFLPGFLIAFYWQLYILAGLFFTVYLIGVFLFIKARIDLSKRTRCAICNESLGYIFGSYSYRNNAIYWNKDFPEHITCCPHCKTPLDKEINTELEHSQDSVPSP